MPLLLVLWLSDVSEQSTVIIRDGICILRHKIRPDGDVDPNSSCRLQLRLDEPSRQGQLRLGPGWRSLVIETGKVEWRPRQLSKAKILHHLGPPTIARSVSPAIWS